MRRLTLFLLLTLAASYSFADPSLMRLMDMSEQLDRMETVEFGALLSKAEACTSRRDFACAASAIDQGRKLAKSSEDKRRIELAWQRVDDEKRRMQKEEEERQYRLAQAQRQQEEANRQTDHAAQMALITDAIRMAAGQITQARVAERQANQDIARSIQSAKDQASVSTAQRASAPLRATPPSPSPDYTPATGYMTSAARTVVGANGGGANYLCTRDETIIGMPGECEKILRQARERVMEEYVPIDGSVQKRNGRGVRGISACEIKRNINAVSKQVDMDHVLVTITYESPSNTPCDNTGGTRAR